MWRLIAVGTCYLVLRLATGPWQEALSTSIALVALLLGITRLIGASDLGQAYRWIGKHGGEISVYVGIVVLVVGAAIYRGAPVFRAVLHGVLFVHFFWLFELVRQRLSSWIRGRGWREP